ncbi:response regulator transcription factor [Streptomyces sp. NPDC005805]|uniref:response regulator transcription factor n=1 Tax=Streptomyces sp. NPDC005805 TaxID=3157068 RepID=UPI003405FB7C
MVRVLVVHDAELLRSALVELLRTDPALDVASTHSHPAAARRAGDGDGLGLDVRVVDVDCTAWRTDPGGGPGPDSDTGAGTGTGTPGGQSPALLVLATPDRPGLLRRALDEGALGLVDKNAPGTRLITAVHTVAKGERFLDASLAFALLDAPAPPLTRRELRVVDLAAQGEPIAEIAARLHLSRGTVRNYMASAIRKVGARNRMDAIRIVRDAGWA